MENKEFLNLEEANKIDININESFIDDDFLDIEAETPETPEENGISYNLIKLIKDEWEAIQGYNDFLQFLRESNSSEDIISVIEDITREENTHVGQLQALMQIVAPNAENIGEGELEAEKQLNGPGSDDQNNDSIAESYVNVSYKNNDVYQSIIVKANSEEEAEEKFKAKKPKAEFIGARKMNDIEFDTEHNKKGKPILGELHNKMINRRNTLNESPDASRTWRYNGEEIPYDYRHLIKKVIIEEGVTEIGKSAFEDCTSLQSITIPNSVEMLGYAAFKNCISLKSITIPNSGYLIGGYTFKNCKSLESVKIPKNIKWIDEGAFYGCTSLKDVYYSGTKDEWWDIHIGEYNDGLSPTRVDYHFNSNINESLNESINDWIEVKSKSVQDSDGFLTDYTMYKNQDGSKYIFMFGDKDYEEPDESYADWEAETEKEANDWFNSYEGFEDEDDDYDLEFYSSDEALNESTNDVDDKLDRLYGEACESFGEDLVDKIVVECGGPTPEENPSFWWTDSLDTKKFYHKLTELFLNKMLNYEDFEDASDMDTFAYNCVAEEYGLPTSDDLNSLEYMYDPQKVWTKFRNKMTI